MILVDKLEKEKDAEIQKREKKIEFIKKLVKIKTGKVLNNAKTQILRYSLPPETLTYKEIAYKICRTHVIQYFAALL